jgi:hypothetical protein
MKRYLKVEQIGFNINIVTSFLPHVYGVFDKDLFLVSCNIEKEILVCQCIFATNPIAHGGYSHSWTSISVCPSNGPFFLVRSVRRGVGFDQIKSMISSHRFGIRSFSLLAPSLVVPDKPKFKPVQKDQDWYLKERRKEALPAKRYNQRHAYIRYER